MGGRLDFTAKFRDLQVAEDVQKKAELGWLEMEFTVYGTAYLLHNELCYKVSSDAGKIYQFIEESAYDGIYCSNIMEHTHKCLVPIGMKDEILLEIKKQLAYKLHAAYPRELFELLERIAQQVRTDDAYTWLLSKQEYLEGLFDEKQLNYYRELVQYCYSLQSLSETHYRELLHWIKVEEESLQDGFASKDIFEKTFYGVVYRNGERYKYIEDSVAEYIYRKKSEFEQADTFVSPIFKETLWYNYQYTLKDCKQTYSALFKQTMDEAYLNTLSEITKEKRTLRSPELAAEIEAFQDEARTTLTRYLNKWALHFK